MENAFARQKIESRTFYYPQAKLSLPRPYHFIDKLLIPPVMGED